MKKKATYLIAADLLEKVKRMASLRGGTQTNIIETLIDRSSDILPRTIEVYSFEPFMAFGETWEEAHTGQVEVTFPEGAKMARATFWVENQTFSSFTRDLASFAMEIRGD